ncbi:MAG TPA: formylmethanofuran dehydrogenase subunit E family protein [Desulfosalsimonadaceae bacterium]|nr:formylmethanofuran dehydrogenase subunit E family protein [Desulfosalsimonadaceae bacterium]
MHHRESDAVGTEGGHGSAPAIGSYTYKEYVELANRFHGYPAPGIIVGGFMVAAAKDRLPPDILFDAISETCWCLPDAVQILTPCTAGNGWLKILDLGIFAVSLYDKSSGRGVRVALDGEKVSAYSEIAAWFLKLREKKDQDSELLAEQIREAGPAVCSFESVCIQEAFLQKRSKGNVGACPVCGAVYPFKHGSKCRLCQGQTPYSSREALS